MPKPITRWSQRGLLLVEAVLAAVVIGVGLVLISRGLAGQLQTLRRLEAQYRVLSDARGQLTAAEALGLSGPGPEPVPPQGLPGLTEEASEVRWAAGEVVTREAEDAKVEAARHVTLSVVSSDPSGGAVEIRALWPPSWVPDDWPAS